MSTTEAYVPATRVSRPGRSGRLLIAVGIVAVSVNLRPAITSLGALLTSVRADLGMSGVVAGFLTALPVLAFAVFGAFTPAIARRLGSHQLVLAGVLAIVAGLGLRIAATGGVFFVVATTICLAGIAVANILLPVLIKHHFPGRIGLMTGVYSTSMAVGTALPAAVTVPVTEALGQGWRGGMAVWAVCAAVATAPWVLLARSRRHARDGDPVNAVSVRSPRSAETHEGGHDVRLQPHRSSTAWGLVGFFGMQSLSGYSIMGWLPQIFQDAGASAQTAGYLLSFATMLAIPIAMFLPTLAARRAHQGPYVVALVGSGIAGYLGLIIAPSAAPWLWALLLGLANCSFPLALAMIGLRSRSAAGVAQLSSFAQGIGYLVAAAGPLGVGALHQVTGGWTVPLALLIGFLLVQLGSGLLAARPRYVENETGGADAASLEAPTGEPNSAHDSQLPPAGPAGPAGARHSGPESPPLRRAGRTVQVASAARCGGQQPVPNRRMAGPLEPAD